MFATEAPFPQYLDSDGSPLDNGRVYFGVANQNPETAPQTVYWDTAGTQPVAQPVQVKNGYTMRAGTPALVYTSGDYSLTIKDKRGSTVYYAASSAAFGNSYTISQFAVDAASNADAAKGAGSIGFGALNYVAKTVGGALIDDGVNVLWFVTNEAMRAAIKAKTYADDHTAIVAAALTYANGRALKFPGGGYKVSAAALSKAGTIIHGEGFGVSVIRSSDASQSLFTVTANDVQIRDIELQGAAIDETNNTFAVYTNSGAPVTGLKVLRVKFSGQDGSHGFNNAIKLDDGCHYGEVSGCYVERLVGTTSGHGYGVLLGNVKDPRIIGNWLFGTAGHGRHGVYLSAGCNGAVVAFNVVDGFVWDGITQYSNGVQPPCSDNLIAYNRVTNCASIAATSNAGISVSGHALRTQIVGNRVIDSLSCGIKVDGTGFTDTKDTTISGNEVVNARIIGVDLISAVGGALRDNYIKDSSYGSAGTSANVRFISDGATATSDWICDGNRIPASATARAAFQTNATAPTPTGLKFSGGSVGSGTSTDYEWAGGTFAVDGYIRYSTAHNPANLASGAADSSATFTVNGAEVGDAVEVWHSNDIGGVWWSGFVTAANTVRTTRYNLSGGANDPANGTIYINVRKRTP